MSTKRAPKRLAGEGTTPYELPDGRWRSELVVGTTAAGKRIRKRIYGKTRAECQANLNEAIFDRSQGILTVGRSPKLMDWIDYWIDNTPDTKIRERSKVSYRSAMGWVRKSRVASIRLDKLEPEDLEAVYRAMRKAGRSETTIATLHRMLRRALKVAVQRKKIPVNPADRMDAPQPAHYRAEHITMADAKKLLQLAMSHPDGARWMVSLALGARQGEVLGIAWPQIDLDAASIAITSELYRLPWKHGCHPGGDPTCGRRFGSHCPKRHGGGMFIGRPKSEAGDRIMQMPPQLVDALRIRKAQQAIERASPGWKPFVDGKGKTVDLVFDRPDGRCRDSRQDWAAWKKLLADAKVPAVRLHDARHTAATMLLVLGVRDRVVMDMMGWSQSAMLKRYQHVLDDMKKEAASLIGDQMFGTNPDPDPTSNVISLAAHRERTARREVT